MIKEILEQLESLKKECNEIVFEKRYECWEKRDKKIMSISNYIYDQELFQDNEGRDLVFQILNDGNLKLPEDIKKLQVYYGLNDYSTNIITSNTLEKIVDVSTIKNLNGVLSFKKSFSLPDWQTLEDIFPEIYTRFSELLKKEYPNLTKYEYYEKYDEHTHKILGHELPLSFIGGYSNQWHFLYYDKENLDFIMQIQTNFGNGDIIYVFREKSAPYDFKVYIGH